MSEDQGRALDTLAGEKRWMAWCYEQNEKGVWKKPPYQPWPNGIKADHTDPANWDTRANAEEAAALLRNGVDAGVGIALGNLGDGRQLVGIDIDSCIDDQGELKPWASLILGAARSYSEELPSGGGVKVFLYCNPADARPFLDMLGVGPKEWGTRRGVGGEKSKDHGPAIEVYVDRHYFTTTHHPWASQPDKIEELDLAALERLAEVIKSVWAPPASRGGDDDGKSRSEDALALGAQAWREGATFDQMCEVLRQHPKTADWYNEKGVVSDNRELKRIWQKAFDDATEDELLSRLGKLSELGYAKERTDAAKKIKCKVSLLDKLVNSARRQSPAGDKKGAGRPLTLPEPKPWPDPVAGEELIDDVTKAIRRYVILGEDLACSCALWVIAAHAFDEFAIFPRLFVSAPEKGCGKTTLLDVLFRLSNRPIKASNITAAGLFRTIELVHPTLLLDEADAYMRGHEDLRAVIDAGHSRDGAVIRTVAVGDDYQPQQFSCWAPMAIAAIGHLPSTIEDRSIIIRLRRRLPGEAVELLRHGRTEALDELARKIARWVADNKDALRASDPATGLVNRPADNWRPLLAVAEVAGGFCPSMATRIAASLARGQSGAELVGVMLLRELRALFAAKAADELFTDEIIDALIKSDQGPWDEWNKGKPINGRGIAKLLKPFDIPLNTTVRRGDETRKGYRLDWFEDAFARYLPPVGAAVPASGSWARSLTSF